MLLFFAMFDLLDGNPILLAVLAMRGKEFFEVGKRYFKGYNLRSEETLVLASYALMFFFVYLCRITDHLLLLFPLVGSGLMFYANEEAL